jgi:hypothetical protein
MLTKLEFEEVSILRPRLDLSEEPIGKAVFHT